MNSELNSAILDDLNERIEYASIHMRKLHEINHANAERQDHYVAGLEKARDMVVESIIPYGTAAELTPHARSILCFSLPKYLRDSVSQWQEIGFEIHDNGDKFFFSATIPKGWEKRIGKRPDFLYLFDGKGRKRAEVYLYDEKHNCTALLNRAVTVELKDMALDKNYIAAVTVQGDIVYDIAKYESPIDAFADSEEWEKIGLEWMGDNYPDYQNPLKYWD